ncbi:MAG: hemolysin family protein [Planctomycetota bacterium]
MAGEIWTILALIAINGLLSGAEMAIVTVRPGRLRELVDGGSTTARVLQRLREKPERMLATVQIGITVVGATAAAFGGVALAGDLRPLLERWPLVQPHAEVLALGTIVTAISFLSVVLGELVPKSLALRHSESFALFMAWPVHILAWLAAPAVWVLTVASNLVLRPFRDRTNFIESRLSLEEVRSLVDEASEAGTVDKEAGEIASRALDFAGLTAFDVMIHRRWVVALPRAAGADELREALLGSGHRRIPVYEGTLDRVVGYVSWRDAMERVWAGQTPVLNEMLREGHFVAESTPAIDLLKDMQEQRVHLAFVLDEHGGLAGIVTLEDLLEELVGEITSEHDSDTPEPLRREPDGSVMVQGAVPLRDVDRELDLKLDALDDSTTIGGLCIALAGGRIPKTGEKLPAIPGVLIEIVDASTRRVRAVRLRLSPAGD